MKRYLCLAALLTAFNVSAAEPSQEEVKRAINVFLEKSDWTPCLDFRAFPRYASPEVNLRDSSSIARYRPFVKMGLMTEKLFKMGEPKPIEDTSESTPEKMLDDQYALFLTPKGQTFFRLFSGLSGYDKPRQVFCYGNVVVENIESWIVNDEKKITVKYQVKIELVDWAKDTTFQEIYNINTRLSYIKNGTRYTQIQLTNKGWQVF
jgi:hypothetical protein